LQQGDLPVTLSTALVHQFAEIIALAEAGEAQVFGRLACLSITAKYSRYHAN
jgi:hypothetical protein